MDDQGAGGSSRGSDTNPQERQSSLPPTLLQHLLEAPTLAHSPRIAPLVSPDWPNLPTRSRSQGYDLPLPSQPRRPVWFPNPPSGPGYQGGIGASSSSQSRSSSRSQTLPSFSSELYPEGQPEIKPLYQGSSMAESPAIETQEAVPEQKKAQRSPIMKKDPGTSTEEGGSPSTGTGATTSTRRKPSTKVSVACEFCRGEHIGHYSTLVPGSLIELSIGISIRTVCCGLVRVYFCCRAGR